MRLDQEEYIRQQRARLAQLMAHVITVFGPLYAKVERGSRWTADEGFAAESTAQTVAEEVRKIAQALTDTPELWQKPGYTTVTDEEGQKHRIPVGLTPKEQAPIRKVIATLTAAMDVAGALSLDAAAEGARRTGWRRDEFFLYGPWRRVLKARKEVVLPGEEKGVPREPLQGFEFVRAALLRAQKNLFFATADIGMRTIRLKAAAAEAYTLDIVTAEAVNELNDLAAKHAEPGMFHFTAEQFQKGETEIVVERRYYEQIPAERRQRPVWSKPKKFKITYRGAIDEIGRQVAVDAGRFVELVGPHQDVLQTYSPHTNVVEYTIEVSKRKARRVAVANPKASEADEVSVLTAWIRWVEG